MSFIYIASPYTDPSAKVRHTRYLQTAYYVTYLLTEKKFPYSPIVANHHLALEFSLPHTANDWMAYNFAMLSAARELHVLQLPGWAKSVGVLAEVNFWRAARQGAPIHYIDFDATKNRRGLVARSATGNSECKTVVALAPKVG